MKRHQSGIAVLTAILVVAVAATAAAMMLSQQSAMLDQTMLVASRAQADQYATAGLDWARGVLSQDARSSSTDSLDEGWAKPIVGLPIERAVVAGAIADEQGKLNLNSMVRRGTTRSQPDVDAFRRLLTSLELSPDLAEPVVEWMMVNGQDAYYLSLPRPYRSAHAPLTQVDELYRVRGFDARTVEKLRPHVTALPAEQNGDPAKLNANTAEARVLAAACDVAPEKLAGFLAERAKKPFVDAPAIRTALGSNCSPSGDPFVVKSDWFTVLVRVQQDDVQVGTEALLKRSGTAGEVTLVWKRPRY